METIEDMESLGAPLADDLQIGLPHIGTDEDDLRGHFVTDRGEESLKGFDRSFFSDPKQARNVEIDLVNQRQVLASSNTPFGLFWTWKIRRGKRGRPAVPQEVRELIRTMSRENPLGSPAHSWGAVETWHRYRRNQRKQVFGTQSETTVPDVADLP